MEHTKDVINVSKLDSTSIMFDGSHYPIEENLAKTTELVNVAHQLWTCLSKCEVGSIGGEEDGVSWNGRVRRS